MDYSEYSQLQSEMSHLLEREQGEYSRMNANDKKIYEKAVMACKSVLANHKIQKTVHALKI